MVSLHSPDLMHCGRLQLRSRGSPVLGSDWINNAPIGTSRMTRRSPWENGPPERSIEMPTSSCCDQPLGR